jgi:hypothetical protein
VAGLFAEGSRAIAAKGLVFGVADLVDQCRVAVFASRPRGPSGGIGAGCCGTISVVGPFSQGPGRTCPA